MASLELDSATSDSKRSTRRSVSAPVIEPGRRNCIFCGALKKKVPSSSTKQSTSQILTEEAEARLRSAAAIRQDERILIAIGSTSSLIAREVYYHRYCYNEYTRESSLTRLEKSNLRRNPSVTTYSSDSSSTSISSVLVDDGLLTLLSNVEDQLINKGAVVSLSQLASQYNDAMPSRPERNDKVKGVLVERFGESITFVRRAVRNKSELVFATVRTSEIIAQAYDDVDGGDSDDDDSNDFEDTVVTDSTTESGRRVHEGLVQQDSIRMVYMQHAFYVRYARINIRNATLRHHARQQRERVVYQACYSIFSPGYWMTSATIWYRWAR